MLRIVFELVKFAITVVGVFFSASLVLGKSKPFYRTAERIDRRNARNARKYLNYN